LRYAETGVNLEVDLTRGTAKAEPTDPRLTELHLGGLGTDIKLLWDRVPPETDPLSPENVLIFGSGLLTGTAAVGANRLSVTSISPQTQLAAYSLMGGYMAPEMKHAGFDKFVIQGKSPDWVYLWINDGKVEFRDATHLLGMGTQETAEVIKQELKEPLAQVAAIGLAGENQVFYSSIEHSKSAAARLGFGAIMGSKKLKAIAVRGTKDINIGKPAEFYKLCKEIMDYIPWRIANPPKGVLPWFTVIGGSGMGAHDESFHTDNFSWGNARERRKGFWTKEIEKEWSAVEDAAIERFMGCHNCALNNGCGAIVKHPTLGKRVMKCFNKLTYPIAAFGSLEFGFDIAGRAQEYGLDGFSTPQVMAFAVELYNDGILTDEDMPGFPEDNEERFYWLLEKIVRREGIGDILADGVYWAARKIGKGAEVYDHNTIKKHEQVPIKLGLLNPFYYLMLSTGEKLTITQIQGSLQMPLFTQEERDEFADRWIVPKEEFREFARRWGSPDYMFPKDPSIELICDLVDWQEASHYIDNAAGICSFFSTRVLLAPYNNENLPPIFSAATGLDISEEKMWEIAHRNRNLLRAINVRRGLRRDIEVPPEDHWKKRFPDYEKALHDAYYKFKGWNNDGVPTKEKLHELGLDYVAEDFEKRGIYG